MIKLRILKVGLVTEVGVGGAAPRARQYPPGPRRVRPCSSSSAKARSRPTLPRTHQPVAPGAISKLADPISW